MSENDREARLAAEEQVLRSLAEQSTILSLEPSGEPPTQYRLIFEGKGYYKDPDQPDDVVKGDRHVVELRLGYSFPGAPPELRWVTPIFHPNVSSSGFLTLPDIGLEWDSSLTMDVVCERLWDVARAAFVNEDRISSQQAWQWRKREHETMGPADARHLRDRKPPAGKNVIHYQRKQSEPTEVVTAKRVVKRVVKPVPPAVPPQATNVGNGIHFIDSNGQTGNGPAKEPVSESDQIWFLDEQ